MKIEVKAVAIFDAGLKITLDKYITDASRAMYRAERKIEAIKLTRAHYNLGLFEAKELCDWLGEYEYDGQIYY